MYTIIEHLGDLLGSQLSPVLHILMVLNNMGGNRLGVDPAIILAAFGMFWFAEQLFYQVYYKIQGVLQEHFAVEVAIDEGDKIYNHMINWIATHPSLMNALTMRVKTYGDGPLEEEQEPAGRKQTAIRADGSGIELKFSDERCKHPPQFTPSYGRHIFWYKGRLFGLDRKRPSLIGDVANEVLLNDGELILSCYGRSTQPIKELLKDAKQQYFAARTNHTTIYRGVCDQPRGYPPMWATVASRHARPMNTVVLDANQKIDVLSDMNEYLSPAATAWYADRGIPLRRGYLFHGPPGTGKTSLSFALAGVFGLDIYVMSLLDPSISEQNVMSLFSQLPTRCIILLEDIDTAGVARSSDTDEGEKKAENADGKQNVASLDSSDSDSDSGQQPTGISLSGLLNAIDGVASHEGRVLVMTTNKPEALDDALIRPGRVDLQVCVTNATRHQAKELFIRMFFIRVYVADSTATPKPVVVVGNDQEKAAAAAALPTTAFADDEPPITTPDELERVAAEFAAEIPDGRLISPAEIQGYLLKRKKMPRRAAAEVDVWVKGLLEQKAKRTKVLAVQ